uniref:VWFA domain-containing protein n=1 Tax=Leptobrachium leishanense TaxID=445787 RepID=A0A8C5PM11_9ANUR
MEKVIVLLLVVNVLQMSLAQTTDYADVVFLVDGSSTMGDKSFIQTKTFLTKTINQLAIGSDRFRVGLAQYSDDLQVAFSLNTYRAKNPILNHIKSKFSFTGGAINTGNALTKVHESFFNELNVRDKSKYPPILVVITSGTSLDDVKKPSVSLQNDGVRIISMGLQRASIDELKIMATDSSLAFQLSTPRELVALSDEMLIKFQEAVQKYTVLPEVTSLHRPFSTAEPTTAFPFYTTGTNIDPKSVNQTFHCRTGVAADVVFLVDSSRLTSAEHKEIIAFVKHIIYDFEITDYCVHVGIVAYHKSPNLIATLDQGTNRSIVLQLVDNIKVASEDIANTGAAINFTRTDIFGNQIPSRRNQGIEQTAILITHRPSSDSIMEASELLRKENIRVFTVGVSKHNISQLQQISSYPSEQYIVDIKKFSDLSSHAKIFLKKFKNVIEDYVHFSQTNTDMVKDGCLLTEEADIYLLIDGSGSIQYEEFTAMQNFLVDLVDVFDIGPQKVRFGAVQYSDTYLLEFQIGSDYSKTNLKLAIKNFRQLGGGTETGKAMNYTRQLILDPQNARAKNIPVYLIVLTDGESADSVKEAAEVLRSHSVKLFAIGVKAANETQLLEITGDPKRVHFVKDFGALKEIKNKIARQICSSKVCEDMKADVIFLVDSSGSIGDDNYAKMKTFMKHLVNKTTVGRDSIQFGAVQFSDATNLEFQLNSYSTASPIMDAIDRMTYMKETTYTGKALEFVSQYFILANGARPNVKKILILITDGVAHDVVKTPAETLRNSGVIIFSVGVFNANKTQLEEISGKNGKVRYLETFDLLKDIEDELIFEVCTHTEECKKIEKADIVFVMDSSGSIQPPQHQIMKDFVISIINKSEIGPKNVQFGALKYSEDPTEIFYLNTHSTRMDITNAIASDELIKGRTFTAKALEYSKKFFTEERGSRRKSGVPQYLIVITDGVSDDREKLNETARMLQKEGIIVFAIGIDQAKTEELVAMAGSEGKWYLVDSFSGLPDLFVNISEAVCNATECEIESADIVFLIDGSTSISDSNFKTMKDFMVSVVNDFDVASERVHVGVAQYSNAYKLHFRTKRFTEKRKLEHEIQNITQIEGNTLIGSALQKTELELFDPSKSRIREGVHQVLIVITDGKSQDEVAKPAKGLRDKGIDIYAVGVGDVDDTQLLQIAGSGERKFSVENFAALKSIKQRFVRNICTDKTTSNCSADIVVGFDISNQTNGVNLFYSQFLLESRLGDVLSRISALQSATCTPGAKPQISVAFHVKNTEGTVSPQFHIYNSGLIQKLKEVIVSGPSEFTSSYLTSMWEILEKGNSAKAKVLLVFTDGLDEKVELLEATAEQLKRKGLSALVTVALETTHDINDLKFIEFGRGINYLTQMNIGMSDVGMRLAEEMDHVVERTCCCVVCKCTGMRGERGTHGLPGIKGPPGLKGLPGHSGDEGLPGDRGFPGPVGEPGTKGSIGFTGKKGERGRNGEKSNPGEPGLDGVPGEQGNNGIPGKKGEKGDSGEQGGKGPYGSLGSRGRKGHKGDMGEPGANNTIPGPPGAKGDPGSEGKAGSDGVDGEPGPKGIGDIPGRRGPPGEKGVRGENSETGPNGEKGFKGPQGDKGSGGAKGEKGSNGPNGFPGPQGIVGIKGAGGNLGLNGKKGEPGDPGIKGSQGPEGRNGPEGETGVPGYGEPGKNGAKGLRGCPGHPGHKGENGNAGMEGDRGKKGFDGIPGYAEDGGKGDPGTPGLPGRRGRKGPKGIPGHKHCDLIEYVRNKCPCCNGKSQCPVYPTELVFALDMSSEITSIIYQRMLDIVTDILANITIRESNCPSGARISVVSYNSDTKYIIRFSDFQNKGRLIAAVNNIPLERSTKGRDLGGAMRFIARNVFKRSLQGATVRKIVVLFSNGPSRDVDSISTAVMEYSALGIIPAVIAFTAQPVLKRSFTLDSTGTFQVIDIPASGDFKAQIQTLLLCTLCFDTCKPAAACVETHTRPARSAMDITFLLDNSKNMEYVEFEFARNFLSMTIDRLDVSTEPRISNTGDRIALVSDAVHGSNQPKPDMPKVEFDLLTYNSKTRMKRHILEKVQRLNHPPALGFTLERTIDDILSKAPNPRKNKAIVIILFGETSKWDKHTLIEASLTAKCKGYGLFVLSIGREYNDTELTELASRPLDHHLLQLGIMHKPDLEYAVGFLQPYLNSVRRGISKYPPAELRSRCSSISSSRGRRNKRSVSEEELFFENANDQKHDLERKAFPSQSFGRDLDFEDYGQSKHIKNQI